MVCGKFSIKNIALKSKSSSAFLVAIGMHAYLLTVTCWLQNHTPFREWINT